MARETCIQRNAKIRLVVLLWTVSLTGLGRAETFWVTTAKDAGPGSYRDALEQANANPGPDIIEFSFQGIIKPRSPFPPLQDLSGGTAIHGAGITLDGISLAKANPNAGVYILSADYCDEFLCVVQFFSRSGYHACPDEGTEDGFCIGTGV